MRLFVNNLTNIDFSYLCSKRGLVGETWLAHVQLEGSLNHQGMICDFGIVKKKLRDWLELTLDHCLLVPAKSNVIRSSTEGGNTVVELTLSSDEQVRVESPCGAVTLIEAGIITPETVAEWCIKQLNSMFDSEVVKIYLSFSPETAETPYYHYSHGLKKHQGDCQRIAHGHRSKLLIWRDNQLCLHSMHEWAAKWRDIFIGTQEDCVFEDKNYLVFTYIAQQGVFKLTLPKRCCYLVPSDTTVELLAQHLADQLSRQYPNTEIRVQAFEGIGKGAIVTRSALV